jgi:hypothetical protein
MTRSEQMARPWGDFGVEGVPRVALAMLLLALWVLPAVASPVGVSRTLVALERDIGAAAAHATALRDRLEAEVATGKGAEIAGIADGGAGSSLTALRLAARAVDRRLEHLRTATANELSPDRAEVMLSLRASLAGLLWTIETIPLALDPDAETLAERERQLAQLDEALAELDSATAALASFDWGER